MKITLCSSNYFIIDYSSVFLFDEKSDLTFDIDTENNFKFILILKFIEQDNSEQVINRSIQNNVITMECVNFLSSGTGTSKPIETAMSQNKKIYIMFWTYLEGDVLGQSKSRSVKYTLFMER